MTEDMNNPPLTLQQQEALQLQETIQAFPLVDFDTDPMLRSRAFDLTAMSNKAICLNRDGESRCISMDNLLKDQLKHIDEHRKLVTGPIDQAKAAVMGLYNAEKKALTAARNRMQAMLIAFKKKRDAELAAAAAEQKAEYETQAVEDAAQLEAEGKPEEAEAVLQEGEDMAEAVAAPTQAGVRRGAMGGTASYTDHWEHEIENPDAVPREYCSPDPKKIKDALALWDKLPKDSPERKIPGVKFSLETRMANRG